MTKSQETLMQKWAVKTVSDPTVGNLQTPVNSGWFTKMVINNLPVYRAVSYTHLTLPTNREV